MRLECPCCGHVADISLFEQARCQSGNFDKEEERCRAYVLTEFRSDEEAVRRGFLYRLEESTEGAMLILRVYGKEIAAAKTYSALWAQALEYLVKLGDDAVGKGVAFA